MHISLPEDIYNQLIAHLKINSETDADAKVLLEKLRQEAKPIKELSSSAFLIDGISNQPKYSV
ncbi:hypothetical protein [Crocosphaera chwakensis]|uniref:Uncharacterized protein n=1 Tax=Crocosphaera chwakensis CCY0110 TaxID=391612 RepID=A3IZ41_9CHRO|nr:hypothetical protein [Crocosphaera chwakensis]EAZ88245.1 hypothetical protein CY0110_14450 [Crocosphaera chwakensis CCY0110]